MPFYTIVFPVYRSEQIVGETVDSNINVLIVNDLWAEVMQVNDGGPDQSWGACTISENQGLFYRFNRAVSEFVFCSLER